MQKTIQKSKSYYTFAPLIGTLVCRLFHTDSFSTNNNTPLMPLFDAHLRGFFFLYHE